MRLSRKQRLAKFHRQQKSRAPGNSGSPFVLHSLGICHFSSRLYLVGIVSQRRAKKIVINSVCDNLAERCRSFFIQIGESVCHIVGEVEHCRPPFVIDADCIDSVDLIAEDANLGHGLRSRETSLGINFPYQQCRPKGRSHSYGVRTTGQLQAPASLGGGS